MNWLWVAPATTAIGAVLAYFGARAGTRQRARADLRSEWRERFAIALGELAEGADPKRRDAGRTILRSLATSAFANDEDRALADAVLADSAPDGPDADSGATDCDLDEMTATWDDDDEGD